jgi:type II secretory pathway pseudopilin PulG
VELLVVISIIGLLAGLGLPAINGAIQAGKKAEVSAMAESIKTAVNAFYAEYSVYPSNASGRTDLNFLNLLAPTNSTGTSAQNTRGIAFLEVPPKFTNASGIVTPRGFYSGTNQSNFLIRIDGTGAGVLTNNVGGSNYVVPASVSVWVADPKNSRKPVGTFR